MAARILLVDDDPTTLSLLARLLQCEGHHVDASADAREALERLVAAPYDVLLTDHVMPGMSGLELAQRAREIQGPIRCLVTSGQRRPRAEACAGVAWLPKPIDVDELLALLAA